MPSALTRRSVLATCAVAGLAGCGGGGSSTTPSPPAEPSSPQRRRRVTGDVSPVHLSIPGIGVDTRLISLGLQGDGTVEVPTDPGAAGWFRLGTVPGRRGSAVILGHVDSVEGPAVFASLSQMRTRDRLSVVMSDDTVVSFAVSGVATFANADFPARRVYAGTRRDRDLNLVTCGGDYDEDRGGYQSNVVVFTTRTRS